MKTYTKSDGTIAVTLELAEGKQCSVSTGCTDPKQAKAVMEATNLKSVEVLAKAKQLSRELLRKLTIASVITPAEAIHEWTEWMKANANSDNTTHAYTTKVQSWYYLRSPEALAEVTDTELSAWVNAEDGTKLSTRKIRLAALRSFFGYCADREYLTPNPSRTVRVRMKNLTHGQKESRKKVPMTDAEVQKVVDRIVGLILKIRMKRHPKYYEMARLPRLMFWHSVILIGRHTGLRFGDICNLRWENFSPDRMVVWTDKSDTRVELEITEDLHDAICTLPPSGDDWCFPRERKMANDHSKICQLLHEFKAHLKGAGVDTTHTFHDLRHTRATELYQQGMLPQEIAKELGHSSPEITLRYIHPDAVISRKEKEPVL
jgi:integrase